MTIDDLTPITPDQMPDSASMEHPAPWREHGAGNGHYYLYDKNGAFAAHVLIWDSKEYPVFVQKLAKINASSSE